jgi:hypothetical protein
LVLKLAIKDRETFRANAVGRPGIVERLFLTQVLVAIGANDLHKAYDQTKPVLKI